MSNLNASDEELQAIDNGTETVVATQEAPASESPVVVETKKMSLDDALAEAFKKHTPAEDTSAAKPAVAGSPAPEVGAKPVDPITGRVAEPMKAPAGWTPLLKEKWGTVDPTVQKFIHDREKDMAQTISKTADERKLATEFKDIVSPYEATIRQFNVPATQIAKDLFTQWHAMTTGTGQQKAQIFVNLLNHYKPDAQALQQLLAGQQPPAQAAPPQDVDKLVEEKLAAREAKQQEAAIGSDIERFAADPKNEFFPDVRAAMGRLISAEVVQANSMPELFQKAYDLACSQHPEVSQVLAQRATTNPVVAPQAPRAVGSVKPSLGTGQKARSPVKSISLDDAVTRAFAMHNQ